MKFLIQIPQLIFGGAEKVLVNFANDLVQRGHEVEILEIYEKGFLKPQFDSRVTFHAICSNEYTKKYYSSLNDVKNEKEFFQKLYKIGKLLFSKVVGYRKYAEKLAEKHYSNKEFHVVINYLETESPKFLLEKIRAKKYIQWYHIDVANLEDPDNTDKLIPVFSKMDAIICVAKSARKSFVERYPQLEKKTHVLYNFFDVSTIINLGNDTFSYNTDEPVMLSVGRMTEQKKYLRFLDILARLRDDGIKFQWHILGDGYQRDEIVHRIKILNLQNYVFLDGLTDNPYKYMKNCDLFVLPSGWEGFPTVTIEAKILGCPVLATDVSGIQEQIIHGETGWIVDNNCEAIYQGLKLLLDDRELRKKICSNHGNEYIYNNTRKYEMLMKLCR